jgi:hypothetical protein
MPAAFGCRRRYPGRPGRPGSPVVPVARCASCSSGCQRPRPQCLLVSLPATCPTRFPPERFSPHLESPHWHPGPRINWDSWIYLYVMLENLDILSHDIIQYLCTYKDTSRYHEISRHKLVKKKPLLMYSTIRFGTASKVTPQGRRIYRAGVGFELAIKQSPARCLDH